MWCSTTRIINVFQKSSELQPPNNDLTKMDDPPVGM